MARKRKAGDGTVRQRKDGRWEGRIVIGYDDNGYPKTKNVLAKTKKECVEKLQRLKEECGGLKPEKVRPEMPFGDWLTYWYENHSKPKIRPTTQETYESRLDLLGSLLQFHGAQFRNHGFRLLTGRFLALLRVDRLEHFHHNFDLGFGHNRENIAVEMHRAALCRQR